MSFVINLIKKECKPHVNKSYEIIVYLKGNGYFYTPEKTISVYPGKIVVIPPYTVHASSFDESLDRIYIDGEFNQIFNLTSPAVIYDNDEKEGLMLAKMIYNNRFSNSEYVSTLCNAFSHFLLQQLYIDDRVSVAVKDIVDEITDKFYDFDIDLCSILGKSGYAEDYIRYQFKKITGRTPIEFLTKIRINHACYLIDTYKETLSLSEICEKCGYADYSYFSRRFKKLMGISPREYINSTVVL